MFQLTLTRFADAFKKIKFPNYINKVLLVSETLYGVKKTLSQNETYYSVSA